jgi:hypothetical protein
LNHDSGYGKIAIEACSSGVLVFEQEMNVEVIRQCVRAQPFRPFTLRLADGRAFAVPHPDFIAVARRQVIHISAEDDSLTRLDPVLIVSLDETGAPDRAPG